MVVVRAGAAKHGQQMKRRKGQLVAAVGVDSFQPSKTVVVEQCRGMQAAIVAVQEACEADGQVPVEYLDDGLSRCSCAQANPTGV